MAYPEAILVRHFRLRFLDLCNDVVRKLPVHSGSFFLSSAALSPSAICRAHS